MDIIFHPKKLIFHPKKLIFHPKKLMIYPKKLIIYPKNSLEGKPFKIGTAEVNLGQVRGHVLIEIGPWLPELIGEYVGHPALTTSELDEGLVEGHVHN